MTPDEVAKGIEDAARMIDSCPPGEQARLRALAAETRRRHEEIRAGVARLQDSIDTLRLGIKYMLFDLEATRRERDNLRRQQGPSPE